jgi:hypothetical protein
MVIGSPVTLLVGATQPMVLAQSMGMNPFVFLSGMLNHDTQPIPWASNHFSLGIPDMSSHLPPSVSSSYMNPSFQFGGMMPPFSPFLFGGVDIPQPTPMVGCWNPHSFEPNPSFTFPRESVYFYLLQPVHLSFFYYVGSYKLFSHGKPPSILWRFIQGGLVL